MTQIKHPNAPQNGAPKNISPGVELLPKERVEYLAETYSLTTSQVVVVRNAICVGATDAELEFFLATCRRVALDPFARQIWFVKRPQRVTDDRGNDQWIDVGRPETGIDGYRTIAERTGDYAGQSPMQWCGEDGKWLDVWLKNTPPAAAKATILRRSFTEPLVNIAVFSEFCPVFRNGKTPQMWQKMPANQIAKCAEAGGFRRAFPRDLSGLVTDTEMEHVDVAASSSFSAPPLPAQQPAKQLDERKASVQIPANVETRETVPAHAAGEAQAVADTAREVIAELSDGEKMHDALAKSEDDLDRAMAPLVRELLDAKSRDDLQRVGELVSKAKQVEKTAKIDGVEIDVHAATILAVVKPVLERRWRELAPATGRGARK